MTLANKITALRFVLAAAVVTLLLTEMIPGRLLWATVLFVLACATDFVDGTIARRTHSVSNLGTFMDPVADKLLILPTFVVLVVLNLFPLWLFVLMLVRDLFNDAYRNYAVSQRIMLGANAAGKIKTTLQMFSLVLALFVLVLRHEMSAACGVSVFLFQFANMLMIAALIVGAVGTFQFVRKHSRIISLNE